ncbi:MAG: gluconate 2-dehydrogenase subunit 3 family protein [Pseudomonadota bacterium]
MSELGQTRRLFLKSSALSLAGLSLAGCDPSGQIDLEIESEPSFEFFDRQHAAILQNVADLMIPSTETVGAADTGTALYLDQLMQKWASEESQRAVLSAVQHFDGLASDLDGTSYLELDDATRFALVGDVDAASFGASLDTEQASAYRLLKRLIFHIHYSSEAANPDFVLIPGQYRGDLSAREYEALVDENRY